MIIRNVNLSDIPGIIKLNNKESKWVGEKDISFFSNYFDIPFFYTVEDMKRIVGFLMAMDEKCDYGSENYLWFKGRYDKFYYIDRVIVDGSMRGKGIASMLYKEVINNKGSVPLVAEVAIEPPNEGSVKFHDKVGFKEVGTLTSDGKKVRMYYLD